jgi:hypothetical protein
LPLLGCTKGHLSHLERDGIISRADRNACSLVKTVRAVIEHMRGQRRAAGDSRAAWERARAEREALRLAKEAHELCRTDECDAAWQLTFGYLVARLIGIPARVFSRSRSAARS